MADIGEANVKLRLLIGESSAMRPCFVRDKDVEHKALFHCWSHRSDVIDASPLMGGHPGGTISFTVGIVELENGEVTIYHPNNIRFVGTKRLMEEYSFEE